MIEELRGEEEQVLRVWREEACIELERARVSRLGLHKASAHARYQKGPSVDGMCANWHIQRCVK